MSKKRMNEINNKEYIDNERGEPVAFVDIEKLKEIDLSGLIWAIVCLSLCEKKDGENK